MKPDYLEADEEPLTPGWIPEGWDKGDPIHLSKGLNRSLIRPSSAEFGYEFPNSKLPDFFTWLEWWNNE